MNARSANSVFRALQGVAASVEARPIPKSINLTRSVRDFADQDAGRLDALMRVGSNIAGAACVSGIQHRLYADDFKVLKAFVEYAEGDLALSDFTVPDTAVDQPHSPDESHYLDREKL